MGTGFMASDAELLKLFADRAPGAEAAFAELMRRYAGLVYAAARRVLKDPAAAEDATQAVFIVLSRKAPRLTGGTVLAGWLQRTALYVARRMLRESARRAEREKEVSKMRALERDSQEKDEAWSKVRPWLDEALASLPARYAEVLVLRYLAGKPPGEVARELGLSASAVSMRLARGAEKLRRILARRGAVVEGALLGSLLAQRTVEAAPAHLVETTVAICMGQASAAGSVLSLTDGVVKAMFWMKVKLVAAVCALTLAAGGMAGIGLQKILSQEKPASPAAAEAEAPAAVRTYEAAAFKPVSVAQSNGQTVDLIVSDDLERTPRHYLRVAATAKTDGAAAVALILVDVLRREHRGPEVKLAGGKPVEIGAEVAQVAGHPVSLLRGVRLQHQGAPVEVVGLRFVCEDELLPKPEVTVSGPLDDASVQKALNALGPHGGVLYIPAGKYAFKNTVTVPADNVTIYGDGRDTVIQWPAGPPTRGTPFKVSDRKNVRITRLHFQGPPVTAYRGYSEQGRGLVAPEDEGKPWVNSYGITVSGQDVRVDHCEIELFGLGGVKVGGGKGNLVDHCYLHENFRAGYGYGISCESGGNDPDALYIEDNDFENHRHGICGGTDGPYTARFNRLVKDKAVVASWKQNARTSGQITSHEIDGHGDGGGRMIVHDNYVAMRYAMMDAGQNNRGAGNPGWYYRNVLENCTVGLSFEGKAEVWVWDNNYINCKANESFGAPGSFHKEKPPDFKESYPHKLNRLGWWPGTTAATAFAKAKTDSLCAGPAEPQVLREVAKP